MKHILQVNTTDDGNEGMLSLQGELTMLNGQEIKKVLLDAIEQVDALHLRLEDVESVDASFIQLICAAHRECFLSGKTIDFSDDVIVVMKETLERTGYSKNIGCLKEAKTSCLWSAMCS
ncbi:MAG: STAS domain-containing protein [Desulfobulbaceae bacterium]|nr:STAS domain-containing protein [Desulfobulbaceae bacterium]